MGPYVVILHTVVLIDREVLDCVLAEFSFEYDRCRRRRYRVGLIDPVFLGIIQASAYRESYIYGACRHIISHLIVAAVSRICNGNIGYSERLEDFRNDVLDKSVHLPVIIRVTVRQIVLQIADMELVMRLHPFPLSRRESACCDAE